MRQMEKWGACLLVQIGLTGPCCNLVVALKPNRAQWDISLKQTSFLVGDDLGTSKVGSPPPPIPLLTKVPAAKPA